jgi:RsiW-degrading membrane proteinase PrsW (M82 family)
MAPPRPDPERTRRIVGLVIYIVMMLAGAGALVFFFLVLPLEAPNPEAQYEAMGIGALCALPPLAIYLWIPRLIDRFDPEPWWALALVLGWGAIAACGVAATVNTGVEALATDLGGKDFGAIAGACISAPIVEEGMKGVAVFGVFYFLRREFDGVVDGVIYATFTALGFAATENIIYYSSAVMHDAQGNALAATFVLRGILAPWGHPLYTSMTGIGFGISRETNKAWLRWMAPIFGYSAAMFLHCLWNTASTISGFLFLLMLPLWLIFVAAFIGILIWLVARKGRIIRMHLQDEVLLGTLTRDELNLVCSPWGGLRATFGWGGSHGRKFVRTAARLGLSKWHTGRAMKGRKMTVSADWIVPLRQELAELRTAVGRSMGRAVPLPQAWTPGAPQGQPQYPQYPQAYGQPQGQQPYAQPQGQQPYEQPQGPPYAQAHGPQRVPQAQGQQPYPQGQGPQPYPQPQGQQAYPQGQPQAPAQPGSQQQQPQPGPPHNRDPPPGWGRR